ncbi:MAG: T9SS type A sorting domain-containing protein [Bacteroidales bacterium]|nr:T9SS type A sorting domain-containing protein [Bacteroidales bacterium]
MKRALCLWMTVMLMATLGIAHAQNTQWYGYARICFNGETWQNKFITFTAQNPNEVQAVSETLPELWAATYLDSYVWFVTQTRSLCKAPFDPETQTIGAYETVVPALEPYNLYIDMAYNPVDGMMYYLCQDSQYNCYLKRSNLATPSDVEVVGIFDVRMWTLAIDAQGQAYGVAYEGGNLYEIDLNNATTTLVGPTGKEVWYTQSMAFDLDTGELYWAQFATASDHGLYQVNTETGVATSLGEIGLGTQLTGLFMVPQPTPPDPEIINEIYVEGFTAPVWGEHPDFDLEVAEGSHYSINEVKWYWVNPYIYEFMEEDDIFDHEDAAYYLSITFEPEEGYVFSEDVKVFYNGDPSIFDAAESYFIEDGAFMAFTIGFHVSDPTDITELTSESIAVWPNPATNVLYLDIVDGTTVSVFDMTGHMVMQERYESLLDVSNLTPGLYAIKAEGYTVKIVKE